MKHWCLIAMCALVAVSGAASHATAQYKAEFKNSLVVGPAGPWSTRSVRWASTPAPNGVRGSRARRTTRSAAR